MSRRRRVIIALAIVSSLAVSAAALVPGHHARPHDGPTETTSR